MDDLKEITTHNDFQSMNMFIYSDLYNVLLHLFVMLAIGRLVYLWTGYKKEKEISILKLKVNGLDSYNKFQKRKVEGLVIKLKDANDQRTEAVEVKAALKQEVATLKNKVNGLNSSNEFLQQKVEDLVTKLKGANTHRIEALQAKVALKQEKSVTKSQYEYLEKQNHRLQIQVQSLSKNMATSVLEAAEARKSHEEAVEYLRYANELYQSQLSYSEEKIEKLTNTIQQQEEIKKSLIKYVRAANQKLAAAEVPAI